MATELDSAEINHAPVQLAEVSQELAASPLNWTNGIVLKRLHLALFLLRYSFYLFCYYLIVTFHLQTFHLTLHILFASYLRYCKPCL